MVLPSYDVTMTSHLIITCANIHDVTFMEVYEQEVLSNAEWLHYVMEALMIQWIILKIRSDKINININIKIHYFFKSVDQDQWKIQDQENSKVPPKS